MGVFIAALVYFFHPSVRQFRPAIKGEPAANAASRFAALPALLTVMLFTAILIFLAFLGVGMFLFMAGLVFIMPGIFIVSPYFRPMLAVIFLVILVKYANSKKNGL